MVLHFVTSFLIGIRLVTNPMFLINDLLVMTFNLQLLPASLCAWHQEGGGATALLTFDLVVFGLYLT